MRMRRYRYRPELCHVEARFTPSTTGGTWVVSAPTKMVVAGGVMVLTRAEFNELFELVPEPKPRGRFSRLWRSLLGAESEAD